MTAIETHLPGHRAEVLEHLLVRTSRTFALTIPRLEEPTRGAVTLAYLLLRLADTVEDSASWPVPARQAALLSLADALEREPHGLASLASRWREERVTADEGCLELLASAPVLVEALDALSATARGVVLLHVTRSVRGMREMLTHATHQGHALTSLEQLRAYCYVVAGIVGELLTDLFRLDAPALKQVSARLDAHAVAFGEGLQLVNILKDADADAREGRRFLPPDVPRAELFALARADLSQAQAYVAALEDGGAPPGVLAFTELPVVLALATLDRVETAGAGAKLSRDEVVRLVAQVDARRSG
jgi:farnesyl-diphosphate farnesyltransferase